MGVETGDGIDGLAALAAAGLFAASVDAEGEAAVGEVDSAGFVSDGAGLDRV
ncbi:hypothetical protein ACF1AE_30600 [Streptomyces sp. NPDC014986]|uniref:hypothetical protein n=1 Tax=Streptomyces sp. NPDC014986 TaxID=3364934 RepID=UPI0036F5FC36